MPRGLSSLLHQNHQKRKSASFCNILTEATSQPFCYSLFIRSKLVGLAHTEGRGEDYNRCKSQKVGIIRTAHCIRFSKNKAHSNTIYYKKCQDLQGQQREASLWEEKDITVQDMNFQFPQMLISLAVVRKTEISKCVPKFLSPLHIPVSFLKIQTIKNNPTSAVETGAKWLYT